MNRTILSLFVLSLLLFTLPSAFAMKDLMSLHGKASNSGIPITGGDLQVLIYTAPTGGTLIFDSGTDFNNSINQGIFDVLLGSQTTLDLNYGTYYYMALQVNGLALSFDGNARQIFQSSHGSLPLISGPAGPAGADGNVGATGPQGPQGVQGPAGADGNNGADGTNGIDGTNGTDGYTPIFGVDYNNGLNGTNGTNGTNGVDGYTPIFGVDYNNGIDGATGPQGPQGIQGPAGADGNNGLDGANGTDGYTPIFGVDYNNGAQGIQGPQGPAGADGNNGADGTNGIDGTNGTDGYTPIFGVDYNNGLNGTNGTNGTNGVDGYTPIFGVDYNNGIDGANGSDGATGPQGPAGPNDVNTDTTTNLTGILKGTAGHIAQAIAGVDYLATSALTGFLTQIDANGFFAYKSDVNTWGDQRYYANNNPSNFITASALTPYMLGADANVFFYKITDFNYLTFLTSNSSLSASKLIGEVSIVHGGTNASSFNANKFLYYDGSKITDSSYWFSSFATATHDHNDLYPLKVDVNAWGAQLYQPKGTYATQDTNAQTAGHESATGVRLDDFNMGTKSIYNAKDVNATNLHADTNITIGTNGYIYDNGTVLIIGRK